jgi:hypothetical protein
VTDHVPVDPQGRRRAGLVVRLVPDGEERTVGREEFGGDEVGASPDDRGEEGEQGVEGDPSAGHRGVPLEGVFILMANLSAMYCSTSKG